MRKGFTLIEVLIVVAIIGIIASLAIVGLAPTQMKGRDARRIGDLRQVQTALELCFAKKQQYPVAGDWATLKTSFTTGNFCEGVGVNNLPNDPKSGQNYYYTYNSATTPTSYVLAAILEDANNAAFQGSYSGAYAGNGTAPTSACSAASGTGKVYCLSL
ncbi:MAG: prepilin-type N-terminal cleavage/methylation domain-containing protein [Candidatus Liptonbacteria bacterium]|nr:prepilin-type N-terminal cleavage/methylation domain-containing protein [Candidatus Liptonbacteria bacterium]